MKKIFLTTVLAILTIFSFASKPHIDNVVVSTENSTIKWIGSKISENHEGTVNIKKGILMIDHGKLVGGQFSIDMQSISTTDMSDKLNKKLDGHLKNEDFFNVEEFPLAIFTINTIQKASGGVNSFEILADLTIKGITHPVTFISTVKIEGLNFSAIAKIKIDRTKWNIKYGSGSFFENLGDKMILDKIEFDVTLLSVN